MNFTGTTRFETHGYIISCPDGRNWTVSQKVTRERRDTKEEYEDEEIVGYYGAPEHALLEIWRRCSQKSSATSLKAFADQIGKMRTDILDAASKFGWEAVQEAPKQKEKVA